MLDAAETWFLEKIVSRLCGSSGSAVKTNGFGHQCPAILQVTVTTSRTISSMRKPAFISSWFSFLGSDVVYHFYPSGGEDLVEIFALGIEIRADEVPMVVYRCECGVHHHELRSVAEDLRANVGEQIQSSFQCLVG